MTGRGRGLGLVVALAALVVLSGCRPSWVVRDLVAPAGPEPTSTLVGCERAAERIATATSIHLDPACTYSRGIDVTGPGVTVDCRGAHLTYAGGSERIGIAIVAPRDASWSDITIRNCVVTGFETNLRIRRNQAPSLPEGHEHDAGFSDVLVEHSNFVDATRDGVFLDWYVAGVTLRDIEVVGSAQVGVYLDPGATGNLIEGSVIHRNGFGSVVPEGLPFVVGGVEFRYLATGREGVALDGAWGNELRSNWIAGNASGGVFLYENCGEHAEVNLRRTGADTNLITGNVFGGERVGVWLGSRMAQNQQFMACADEAYVEGPLRRVHLDHARANTVARNWFLDVDEGIRVEDDDNQIVANAFRSDDPSDRAVALGTKERAEVLGRPTSGTTISGNDADLPGPDPFQFVWPHVGTTVAGNRHQGAPTSLVAGTPWVVDPFLHAERVWLP